MGEVLCLNCGNQWLWWLERKNLLRNVKCSLYIVLLAKGYFYYQWNFWIEAHSNTIAIDFLTDSFFYYYMLLN